jgi:hypothetical protein
MVSFKNFLMNTSQPNPSWRVGSKTMAWAVISSGEDRSQNSRVPMASLSKYISPRDKLPPWGRDAGPVELPERAIAERVRAN